MQNLTKIPTQIEFHNSIEEIPVEYIEWTNNPDRYMIDMPHRHDFDEVLFISKGGGMHEINLEDKEILDFSIHYIPRSIIHFMRRDKNSEGFTVAFDRNFMENNHVHKFISPFGNQPFRISLSKTEFKNIISITLLLKGYIRSRDRAKYYKCFLITIELLLNAIYRKVGKKSTNCFISNDRASVILREFQSLIVQKHYLHRDVSWYANSLNISSKYLGNLTKKKAYKSPKYLINEIVLKSIKRELLETSKSIKQIAFDYNFKENQLCKFFKKNVGFTMKKYRNS